jgi:hypothetical protein
MVSGSPLIGGDVLAGGDGLRRLSVERAEDLTSTAAPAITTLPTSGTLRLVSEAYGDK